jgi:hypothetical protein
LCSESELNLGSEAGVNVKDFKNFAEKLDTELMTKDRCYDFKNIFAEKFSKKIVVFDSKQS